MAAEGSEPAQADDDDDAVGTSSSSSSLLLPGGRAMRVGDRLTTRACASATSSSAVQRDARDDGRADHENGHGHGDATRCALLRKPPPLPCTSAVRVPSTSSLSDDEEEREESGETVDAAAAAGGDGDERSRVGSSASRCATRMGVGLTTAARFRVPDTLDMSDALLSPRNWGAVELAVNFVMVAQLVLTFTVFPARRSTAGAAASIALFLFWRLAYNLGLGVILRAQSRRHAVNAWLASLSSRRAAMVRQCVAGSLSRKHARRQAGKQRPAEYGWERAEHHDFSAWMAFRCLATMVLANDGWSYLLLCLRLFRAPPLVPVASFRGGGGDDDGASLSPVLLVLPRWDALLGYAAGAALIGFSYWAKMSAHRVVGDYAWYWGDFFFLMEGELTFDGVFELFPHPMYTVGYTAYYGLCLVCRSYTLLMVSLLAHMCQLLFLMLVEEPHIQKTYGGDIVDEDEEEGDEDEEEDEALQTTPDRHRRGASSQQRRRRSSRRPDALASVEKEPVVLANLDPFRNADLSLLILVLVTVITPFLAGLTLTRRYYLAQVIAWMCFHWLGLGAVLFAQGRARWWTRHFERRGQSAAEAFRQFQRTCNMSLVMNHVAFIMMALHEAVPVANVGAGGLRLFTPRVAGMAGGAALIAVGASSSVSAYRVLGDYGWFFGDFFLAPPSAAPAYTGIYRYLNNPDCVLGYLWLYGLSLATASWLSFWVALCSQALHVLFLVIVEVPHMNRMYGLQCRQAAALELLMRRHVRRIGEQSLVREVRTRMEHRVVRVRSKVEERVDKLKFKLRRKAKTR